MTRPELRIFLDASFLACGCGAPEQACRALLRLLRLHPLFDHRDEIEAWIPDSGVEYLLLYALDKWDLTEHGGTVGGAWLTDNGKAVLAALEAEETDGFHALCETHCIHGFGAEVPEFDHDCMAAGPSPIS